MNFKRQGEAVDIPPHQVGQFQHLITKLFQCCQERMQYQTERFGLPDAELRCLLLFGEERYLTPKGIAQKLNVVKSRVTKVTNGLIKKQYIQKIKDPEDSRITLLSLTPDGQKVLKEVNGFLSDIHKEVLATVHPDQRAEFLRNLELLKVSMESVKELMV